MLPQIDLARALLRGRYMAAASAMEWNGVPIDTPASSSCARTGTVSGPLITEFDRIRRSYSLYSTVSASFLVAIISAQGDW